MCTAKTLYEVLALVAHYVTRRRNIVKSLIVTLLSKAAQTIRRWTGGLAMLLH